MTILSSDEDTPSKRISKTPNGAVAERATVASVRNSRAARQQTPDEDTSDYSDAAPVKRKKRSLEDEDATFHIPTSTASRRGTKRTSNAFKLIEEDGIRRPSHYGKIGPTTLSRMTAAKKSNGTSALKPTAGSVPRARKKPNEKPPQKRSAAKISSDAQLDSTVPPALSTQRKSARAEKTTPPEDDDVPQDNDVTEFNVDPASPVQAPPSPPPLPSPPAIRRNPEYRPYSPMTASRGAGPSSRSDWYISLPHAGWHSHSAYPNLPPALSDPTGPGPSPLVPGVDSRLPSTPPRPLRNLKRNRAILSDEESDRSQPPKKPKYSSGEDDNDNELGLLTRPKKALRSVISETPDDQMDMGAPEQDLPESDEVDQLIESEGDAQSPQSGKVKTPPPARLEEDSGEPRLSGNGTNRGAQTETTRSEPKTGMDIQDVNVADTGSSNANQESNSMTAPSHFRIDPEERELKRLLDSYSDVLDQYPAFVRGYRRPTLSPADAPWVVSYYLDM